jgi:hypothetical protein
MTMSHMGMFYSDVEQIIVMCNKGRLSMRDVTLKEVTWVTKQAIVTSDVNGLMKTSLEISIVRLSSLATERYPYG